MKVNEEPATVLLFDLGNHAGLLESRSGSNPVNINAEGPILLGDTSQFIVIFGVLAIEKGIPVNADNIFRRFCLRGRIFFECI